VVVSGGSMSNTYYEANVVMSCAQINRNPAIRKY
jgi:hypothetical protein